MFSFEFVAVKMQEAQPDEYDCIYEKYTSKKELKEEYINCLSHDTTKAKFESLNSNISNCATNADVQSYVTEFINIIEVSALLFKTAIKYESSNFAFAEENVNPWYTDECHEKRYYLLHMLDKCILSKNGRK